MKRTSCSLVSNAPSLRIQTAPIMAVTKPFVMPAIASASVFFVHRFGFFYERVGLVQCFLLMPFFHLSHGGSIT